MHDALKGLSGFAGVYLDDILVFSKSIPKHLEHVCTVLQYLHGKKNAGQAHQMQFLAQFFAVFGLYCVRQGGSTRPRKGQGYC